MLTDGDPDTVGEVPRLWATVRVTVSPVSVRCAVTVQRVPSDAAVRLPLISSSRSRIPGRPYPALTVPNAAAGSGSSWPAAGPSSPISIP